MFQVFYNEETDRFQIVHTLSGKIMPRRVFESVYNAEAEAEYLNSLAE